MIRIGEGPPFIRLGSRAIGIGIDEVDADAWLAARRVTPPGWSDAA
jgi:hypothetical protein